MIRKPYRVSMQYRKSHYLGSCNIVYHFKIQDYISYCDATGWLRTRVCCDPHNYIPLGLI